MDRAQYRRAFDSLRFSPDFQERTEALLLGMAKPQEQEDATMNRKFFRRPAVLAAVIALVVISVSAAAVLLSPSQVAGEIRDPLLAEAFQSEGAVLLEESVESGGYRITLSGLVSGAGLSELGAEVDEERTYAVLSLQRTDGRAVTDENFGFFSHTLTPLVSGYSPSAVNSWTLDAYVSGFAKDGVYYYLLDTQSLEMFADHTVYLAFYEGGVPTREYFTMAEDGSIAFAQGIAGPHALFTLPLDESRADPAAVDDFLERRGINPMLGFTD